MTYGSLHCGMELMVDAWPNWTQTFSVGGTQSSKAPHTYPGRRPPADLLRRHPVNLLLKDCGKCTRTPSRTSDITATWRGLVTRGTPPAMVIESWPATAAVWDNGPSAKGARTLWKDAGYATSSKYLQAHAIGGPTTQSRYLVVRHRFGVPPPSAGPSWTSGLRPFGNCLTPPRARQESRTQAITAGVGHPM